MYIKINFCDAFGFVLNLFMICTWMLAGWQYFSDQPYQLKFCVFGGALFGLIGTLPSLVMKYDNWCLHLAGKSSLKLCKYDNWCLHLACKS